jgi:hypothetical protein
VVAVAIRRRHRAGTSKHPKTKPFLPHNPFHTFQNPFLHSEISKILPKSPDRRKEVLKKNLSSLPFCSSPFFLKENVFFINFEYIKKGKSFINFDLGKHEDLLHYVPVKDQNPVVLDKNCKWFV